MTSLNQVSLIGNLGADPEIRRTQDGRPIANLSVATSESWKDKNTGEKRESVEWHRVVIFAEGLCRVVENYLRKGSKVFLQGQMKTRKYQDNNGADRWTTEVVLQGYSAKLVLLDRSDSNRPPQADDAGAYGYDQDRASGANTTHAASADDMDDEIPF